MYDGWMFLSMAKEILKSRDQVFVGHSIEETKFLLYHNSSLISIDYEPHWNMLKKFYNTLLFSIKILEALQHLRRDQVFSTIQSIF